MPSRKALKAGKQLNCVCSQRDQEEKRLQTLLFAILGLISSSRPLRWRERNGSLDFELNDAIPAMPTSSSCGSDEVESQQ
jgi:hypothetical protein